MSAGAVPFFFHLAIKSVLMHHSLYTQRANAGRMVSLLRDENEIMEFWPRDDDNANQMLTVVGLMMHPPPSSLPQVVVYPEACELTHLCGFC
jgi:hypothetical protein